MKALKTLGVVIVLASAAFGASGGTISGTVKDPKDAAFKGAFVRARNEGKKTINIHVLTDRQGHYRIENLAPGQYELEATAIGYKSEPPKRVQVSAGKPESVNFALQNGMVKW